LHETTENPCVASSILARTTIENETKPFKGFFLLLCNGLNIDLVEESNKKIKKNMEKYSVDKAVGNSKKYKKMVYLD